MTNEQLNEIKLARQDGKKIGLVQGSWDLFHIGHLKYLKKAKELCDFLVVGMDSDEKIRSRKGISRPIIPETEREEFIDLLAIANIIVLKLLDEPKWHLIKEIKPDVLVCIKENYSDEELEQLKEYCSEVAVLPRQSETSTSDKIRKIIISERNKKLKDIEGDLNSSIENLKQRIGYNDDFPEPLPMLIESLKNSTDYICPVAACCYCNGEWHFGTNQVDINTPKYDIQNRTELYYSSVEHAEINLLKKLGNVSNLDVPFFTTLFPCDKCMKVLIDKGVKEIFYLEDHPERNWSKRSHALASQKGIKTTRINTFERIEETPVVDNIDMMGYKFIYPPNAREQEQLDIMMSMEAQGKDPLAPEYINQEILFKTDFWFISKNRFPYNGVEAQFLIASLYPIYDINDVSPEMWNDLQKVCYRLIEEYKLPGGAICFRYGNPAYSGSSLKRLHAHLITPKQDEKTKFTIGGHQELRKELKIRKNYGDQDGEKQ